MMNYLQRLGRSLMLPVALLPAAALMMGIGYWIDPTGWGSGSAAAAFFLKAGGALIDNLPLLFALGVSIGMPKKKDAASAMSGLAAWLIITTILSSGSVAMLTSTPVEEVAPAFGKIQNAFIGILSGIIGSICFDKYYATELPTALAFFSGKRLAAIMATVYGLAVSLVLFFAWPVVYGGLVSFGTAISGLGAFGAALYGFFNRLLIPTGLHHALNSVFWFDTIGINDLGKFWGAEGGVIGETGRYMAGFFPIMMFGLPGAGLAMYRKARPENRKAVGSLMLAAGFAAFFTGVTEPLEFSFMFVAPVLYLMHAGLTAVSMFITASLKWFAGFGFSAGLVDYVLSFKVPFAVNIIMLIPLGLVFFALYYFVFSWAIEKFDLKTPGRGPVEAVEESDNKVGGSYLEQADQILVALGGDDNLVSVDNCATRLRLDVKDSSIIDEEAIKRTGAAGVVKPSKTAVQIIIGPKVQFVADALKELANK